MKEVRALANRSEGLGWPGPIDKSEAFRCDGRAQSPQVRDLGARAGLGPVNKSEGFGGLPGPGTANTSEVFWDNEG